MSERGLSWQREGTQPSIGERLLSDWTLGIRGLYLMLLGEEGRLHLRALIASQPVFGQPAIWPLGTTMSHLFPRNGPGSRRAVPRPGAAHRQGSIQPVPDSPVSHSVVAPGTALVPISQELLHAPFPLLVQPWFQPAEESSLTTEVQSAERMPTGHGPARHPGVGCADERPCGCATGRSPPL